MTMVGAELGGRYRLDALVGAGGMATVYRARDLRLDRDVAVKILSPNLAADETLAARFEQEARFLAALSHPAIVAVYDVGAADGDPYFVMELVDGESLAERLERQGPLPPDEAIPIVTTIARGLADLHARGFLHRDVKPQNILIGADGSPRLADFGLVRSDDTTSELTAPGTTVGTLAYLAPELLRGGPASPASDVYALAVVAYRALTGRSPYPAQAVAELVDAQASLARPPSALVPELGESFDGPILAGLAEERERPGAEELADGLSRALETWAAPSGAASPAATKGDEATTVVPVAGTAGGALAGMAAGAGTAGAGARTTAAGAGAAGADLGPRPGWLERRRTRQVRHAVGERRGRLLAAWIVGGAILLAGVGLLFALSGAFDRPAGSAAVGATGTPRATPSPTKAPTQAQGPYDAVIAAVADYRTALDGAAGGRDGLKGKEANDLRQLAERVESAARDRNAQEVRQRADELRKKTEEEVRKAGLRGDRADALLAAARRVDEAAGRLAGGGDGDDD